MRATKAYIASLGTTGVLLGASLLMLAIVSAVVAFDRWPDGHVSTRVQTLVLSERAPAVRVGTHTAASGDRAARHVAAALRGATRTRVPVATVHGIQRVAGERVGSGRQNSPASTGPGLVKAPVDPPSLPNLDPLTTGDTSGVVDAAVDGTQSTTGQLGGSVGGVNPDAGQAVSKVGEVTADALRQVPWPGPVFPG
jgi:hypothetical protein